MTDSRTTVRHRILGPESVVAVYAVLLLVVPSAYTFGSYAVTVAMFVGVLAAVLWLSALVVPDERPSLGPEPARRAILIYLGLMLVSYLVAMLRPLDDVSAGSADRGLVGLIAVAGAALLAADHIRDRDALYRVLGALVAAGGVLALIGILQYTVDFDLASRLRPPGFAVNSNSGFIYTRAGFSRVAGTTSHPIEFGIVCALLLPIALHLAWYAPSGAGRRIAAVSVALLSLALPMALSRAAVSAAIVGLAIVLPAFTPERRWKVFAGVAVLAWSITLLAPGILSTVRELFVGEAASGSNAARTQSTDAAIDLFADEPLFGHGFGTLHGFIVDNQFLVTMVQSGVLGVVGLLILGNGPTLTLRIARRTTGDEALRSLGLALMAVIPAVAVSSFGLATLVYPATSGVLFLTIGLAGALHRITAGDLATEVATTRPPELAPAQP